MSTSLTSSVLLDHLAVLPDPRTKRTPQHKLIDIVALTICGVLGGADNWVDIALFGQAKEAWFRRFLELPHGIPSHDTFGRVFARLDPNAFEAVFRRWVSHVQQTITGVVSIDGKSLRRLRDTHRLLTLSLLNASDQPLAVVDLPDHCSLTLEPDTHGSQSAWTLAHDSCGNIQAQADHLVVLQPGEIHSVTLDLARPRWHARTQAGEVVPIGRLPNQRFRLVYRAPDAGDGPRGSAPVWRGELPSPAFWAAGRVD